MLIDYMLTIGLRTHVQYDFAMNFVIVATLPWFLPRFCCPYASVMCVYVYMSFYQISKNNCRLGHQMFFPHDDLESSWSLSFSIFRFIGHFPGEPGLAACWSRIDYWSWRSWSRWRS